MVLQFYQISHCNTSAELVANARYYVAVHETLEVICQSFRPAAVSFVVQIRLSQPVKNAVA